MGALRKVDINTGISNNLASVRQDTMLTCSANHSTVAYAESNISSGEFGSYDVSMDSFTESSTGWFTFEIGVNRNGKQFSVPTYGGMFVYDENLTKIDTIGNYASDLPIGVVYSPIADVMYLAWHDSDAIQAFNIQTLEYIESIDTETSFDWVGNHAFQEGRLRISDNGLLLFATVDGGVRMYEVPEPATIAMLGLGALSLLRRRKK